MNKIIYKYLTIYTKRWLLFGYAFGYTKCHQFMARMSIPGRNSFFRPEFLVRRTFSSRIVLISQSERAPERPYIPRTT